MILTKWFAIPFKFYVGQNLMVIYSFYLHEKFHKFRCALKWLYINYILRRQRVRFF